MPCSRSPDAASGARAAGVVVLVVAAAAAVWLGFFAVLLEDRGGDPSRLVVAGDRFVDRAQAPAGLAVLEDSTGYDGQFYYRLALDPWTDRETDFGVRLDRPAYRQQRILYPLTAHALARGQPAAVPAALAATNLLALLALAGCAATWARRAGADPWLGLACALYPGLVLGLARDLAEPVEAAAVVAGLWLLRTPRAAWAALPLALAVLTRETVLPVVAAVGAAWLPRPAWLARRAPDARPPLVAWLVPVATWLAWQAWLAARWDVPFLVGIGERGVRLSGLGFLGRLVGALDGQPPSPTLTAAEIVALLALAAALVAALPRSRATLTEKLAPLLLAALIFSRGASVWIDDWAFLRISTTFGVLTLLVLAGLPALQRRAGWLVAPAAAGWLVLAVHVLRRDV
jgi:hypothetical protein